MSVCARNRSVLVRVCVTVRRIPALPSPTPQGVIEHANNRTQFNDKLRNFALIQGKFAEMEVKMFACESLAYMVAGSMDNGSQDYQIGAGAWACTVTLARMASTRVAT